MKKLDARKAYPLRQSRAALGGLLCISAFACLQVGCSSFGHFSSSDSTPASDPLKCPALRMDQVQPGGDAGSMQNVEVRDQGAFGICYAESATQMCDAYRFEVLHDPETGRQSAVMSAALGLNSRTAQDPFEGGQTCSVLDYLSKNGFHDSYTVSKCILMLETKTAVEKLSSFYDAYQAGLSAKQQEILESGADWGAPGSPYGAFKKQLQASSGATVLSWLGQAGVPAASQPPLAVLEDLWDLPKLRFIWGIETYQCYVTGPTYTAKLPSCSYRDVSRDSTDSIIDRLNQGLSEKSPIPIEINYCADVLTDGRKSPGFMRKTGTCTIDSSGSSSAHASLVIGRRPNAQTQKCEFLVRNSWGRTCLERSAPVTLPPWLKTDASLGISTERIQGGPVYSSDWSCENGNVWVDGDTLAGAIFGVSRLNR